jgi:hypothetical protein
MITGLYGCSCHPFTSWEKCVKAHKQKFKIDDPVTDRCTGRSGVIFKVHDSGFVTVKYGKNERDKELEHVARLIKKG